MGESRYVFESQIALHPLGDGSGYALFHRNSGITAFLKSLKDPFEPVTLLSTTAATFTRHQLTHDLGLSNGDVEQLITWLLKTNFIRHEID